MSKHTIREKLEATNNQLNKAKNGLDLMRSKDGAVAAAGFHRVLVFGRAVTSALQTIRSSTDEFESWYKPWQAKLIADPIAARFYAMRSEVLKAGKTDTTAGVLLNGFFDPEEMVKAGPAGAKAMFIGDHQGRSGWDVQLPDGSVERVYDKLPEHVEWSTRVDVTLRDLPAPFSDQPTVELAEHYIALLDSMVGEANSRFAG